MKPSLFLAALILVSALFLLSCDDETTTTGPSTIPNEPSNPYPADGATGISTDEITLAWEVSNPQGEDLTYTLIWFIPGIASSRDTISGLTTTQYTLQPLHSGVQYAWNVIAMDAQGETNYGPTWTFDTEDEVATFNDYVLELLVRQATGQPTGDLYASSLIGLTSFEINNIGLADLTGMQYLIGLRYLNTHDNPISDISPLSNLIWIRQLRMSGNDITNITSLSGMTALEWLELSNNQIGDISSLSEMTRLEDLDLYSNQIGDISPLANLTQLEELSLSDNQINDVSSLANLTRLQSLNISENQIADISPVSGLLLLNFLYLGDNQITDISSLSGFVLLRSLYLNNNQVEDISALSNFILISDLHLEDNQIADIEPLVNNTGLGQGDHVYLQNNPLDSLSINVYIPELQARGVWVEY